MKRIWPLLALLGAIGLTMPADVAARRAMFGPPEVTPGDYVVFRVVGFPRHRRDIYTKLRPGDCPALDTCTNGVGRDSRVNRRGRGYVRFHWPKTFLGYDANMVFQRYPWSDQTQGVVKVCTFPGPPRCARKVVQITAASATALGAALWNGERAVASKTKRCSFNGFTRFPGVSNLRATRTTCRTARQLARKVQDNGSAL